MPRSSILEKLVTDALSLRITQTEADIAAITAGGGVLIAEGDDISLLNNDAQYQTLGEVDAAINALINSAPGTLDTLGELAAALNDNDSEIAAIVAVDTQQNTDIAALQTSLTSVLAELIILNRDRKINVETLTADKTLTVTDFCFQQYTVTVDETITLPVTPSLHLRFAFINTAASTGNLLINGDTVLPGERYELIYNGANWTIL